MVDIDWHKIPKQIREVRTFFSGNSNTCFMEYC